MWILSQRSIKKKIYKTEMFKISKAGLIMHSILVWGSFCTNYCFSAVWHKGNQPVALLRCYWSTGCFDSDLLLLCIVCQMLLIFLFTIPHRFSVRFRSGEFAGQSSTVLSWSANNLQVVVALLAGAKVLLQNEISISIKLFSRWKQKVLQNLLEDGCIDFGLD